MKKKVIYGVLSLILFFSFLIFFYFKSSPDNNLVEKKKEIERIKKENIEVVEERIES